MGATVDTMAAVDVFGLAVTVGGAFLRDAAIAAAHELGALAALGGDGLALEPLAVRLGLDHGRRLRPLLDVLVAADVLARTGERYRLASAIPPRPEVPAAGWGLLAQVIRADRPLVAHDDADGLARYHRHLLAAGAAAAIELAASLPSGALLDLGSGAGGYSAAFLAAHPHASATLVDEAAVLALARAHLDGRGLGARARYVVGDARTPMVDRGFDVALLANLLHLHPPPARAAMVAAAAAAVVPGGLVVVKDLRLDDDRRGAPEGLWFALDMALYTDGGDVHTTGALTSWFAAAGLVDVEVRRQHAAPDGVVVIGRRPQVVA